MRSLIICLTLLLPSVSALAQPAADARVYVQPQGEIYAGQLFTLYVEAKTETYFLTTPSFPQIAFEQAIAIQPERLGISFSERVGRTMFAGVRQRFLVSSHRPGLLEIPAYSINFSVASTESARQPVPVTVVTEPLTINIVMPPGLDTIQQVAITPDLRIDEQFDKPLEDLKVGDAFTRSIILESNGAMGFILPAAEFQEIEGLAIYSSQPRFEDDSARGRTRGRRIDSATYLLQQEGSFELPAVSVSWFDLENDTLETLVLEPHAFEVAINPALDSIVFSSVSQNASSRLLLGVVDLLNWIISHWVEILSIAFAILVAIYLWRKYARWSFGQLSDSIYKLTASEQWMFAVLLIACLFQSSATIKHKLLIWMLRGDNSKFNRSRAYQEIKISYRDNHKKPLRRISLAWELLAHQFSKGVGERYDSVKNLNP